MPVARTPQLRVIVHDDVSSDSTLVHHASFLLNCPAVRATHVAALSSLYVLAPIFLPQSFSTARVAFPVPHCESEEEPPPVALPKQYRILQLADRSKDRTHKHECCFFLRSIFLPLEMGCLLTLKRFPEAADYFAFEKHSLAIFCPG